MGVTVVVMLGMMSPGHAGGGKRAGIGRGLQGGQMVGRREGERARREAHCLDLDDVTPYVKAEGWTR